MDRKRLEPYDVPHDRGSEATLYPPEPRACSIHTFFWLGEKVVIAWWTNLNVVDLRKADWVIPFDGVFNLLPQNHCFRRLLWFDVVYQDETGDRKLDAGAIAVRIQMQLWFVYSVPIMDCSEQAGCRSIYSNNKQCCNCLLTTNNFSIEFSLAYGETKTFWLPRIKTVTVCKQSNRI